jgi:hypothetical protein
MDDYVVPLSIQSMLQERVDAFCKSVGLRDRYVADARGKFIFIYRDLPDYSRIRICRLTYLGDTENMPFALFNYKTERYSTSESGFFGAEHLDGTIEGALKAGIEAILRKKVF